MAVVEGFGEDFAEGVQFRGVGERGGAGVWGIGFLGGRIGLGIACQWVLACDQAGVAADLAEAEEGLEDVEALGIELAVVLHSEEEGAGAFEFGVVEGALGAFEFDDDFFLDAGREVAGDLGLGAA